MKKDIYVKDTHEDTQFSPKQKNENFTRKKITINIKVNNLKLRNEHDIVYKGDC